MINNNIMKKNLNFIMAFFMLLIIGCNNPSEKHLELEAAQTSWKKILKCIQWFGMVFSMTEILI